jgi:putative effector of murein hydrolase LrgA (UPF0299 family)
MFIACWAVLKTLPTGSGELSIKLIRLFVPLVVAIVTYFTVSFLLRSEELKYLYTSLLKKDNKPTDQAEGL